MFLCFEAKDAAPVGKQNNPAGRRGGPGNPRPDGLITLAEASVEFQISVRTLQRFRADGRLPGVRQGRYLLIRRDDVQRAIGWQDPAFLLRQLLSTEDRAPLDSWMEGWKQLTRISSTDQKACEAWVAWADEAIRRHRGFTVADYLVKHLLTTAENGVQHDHVDRLVRSMQEFSPEMIARDALREFHTSIAPWTAS